jgi:hypothetical protein
MERNLLLFGSVRRATFIALCFLVAGFNLRAQQSVSIGTTTIKTNAVLYLSSAGKNQGLIIPIVSNRGSVTGEAGMVVYDESDNKLYYRNNSAWVEISGAGGAITLGGDLSGTTTTANVARIQGKIVSAAAPADGQILKFVAASQTWTLSTDNGAVYTAGTGIAIASNQIGIANDGVTTAQIAPNTITNADLNKTTIPLSGFGAAAATVDFGTQRAINLGTPTATTDATTKAYVDAAVATKLNSNALTTSGDLLSHDGTNAIRLPRGANTQVLQSTATGIQWVNNTALTNPLTTLGDIMFGGASGTPTRLAGAAGFLKSTGAVAPTWGSVNLATTDVTGVLPLANGGTNANTAVGARTSLGLGTLATLNAVTSANITDGEIVNADVSPTAAIAGSKIVPTFTQDVTTTTNVGIGTAAPTAQLDILTSAGAKTPQAVLQQTAATGDATQTFSTPLDKYTMGTNAAGSFKISNGGQIGTGRASSGVIDATDHMEITPGATDATGLAKVYFNMGPRGQDGLQIMSTSDWGTSIHLSTGTSMSTTAGYTLAVTGASGPTGKAGDFAVVSGIGSVMNIGSNSGFYAANFPTVDGIFSDTPMRVGVNLASGINPGYNLEVNGSAAKNSGSTWTVTSDRRLKQDISKYSDGLNVINRINPVWFRYNGRAGTPGGGPLQVGVIAQEMKEIAPYTVNSFQAKFNDSSPAQEFYSFDYSAIGYALINAVKELDAKVKNLEQENAQLKQQLSSDSKAPPSDVGQLKAELEIQKTKTDHLEAELKEIKRLLGAEAKKE